jgi:hypothetical protein
MFLFCRIGLYNPKCLWQNQGKVTFSSEEQAIISIPYWRKIKLLFISNLSKLFFWNKYSKGNSCYSRYIKNIGEQHRKHCTNNRTQSNPEKRRKLYVQVDSWKKRSLLGRLESIGLEQDLFYEAPLPSLKSDPISIKDRVVSLLPDEPRPKHEELWVKLLISFYHHHMEGKIKVPMNLKMVPAL